jgi:hypothetical protein
VRQKESSRSSLDELSIPASDGGQLSELQEEEEEEEMD